MKYNYLLEEQIGSIKVISVNRPEKLNTLNVALLKEINTLLKSLMVDDSVRIIIITGNLYS